MFQVQPQEIAAIVEPYITERLDPAGDRWTGFLRKMERANAPVVAEANPDSAPPAVREIYERHWSQTAAADLLEPRITPFEWEGRAFLAASAARKHVHAFLMARALEGLRPQTVVELGCGNGFNLFTLAGRFPGISFVGVELTRQGTLAVARLRREPRVPDVLAAVLGTAPGGERAHGHVQIVQASGGAIPLRDRSVDVAFTVLALEQMEALREQALRELARVARGYVVMIEPFRDWNDDGWRRNYILRHRYFQGRVAELTSMGLEPIHVLADLPNKLSFRVGLVIARVATES